MQRKQLIVRPTAMATALVDAAVDFLDKGGTLPPAITGWLPSRAVKREPTWSVKRAGSPSRNKKVR